jgi:hypothetical protein
MWIRSGHAPVTGGAKGFAATFLVASLLLGSLPEPAASQTGASAQLASRTPPRVFYDCSGQISCQMNHLRTEIRFVDWVNDRRDADVHVIVTSREVGGGGRQYTLDFSGQGNMEHLNDVLVYTSGGMEVERERLDAFTQTLYLGLMRYAVEAGLGESFAMSFTPPAIFAAGTQGGDVASDLSTAATSSYDPWNYWTFRMGLSGNANIQELRQNYRINPSFGADRVTDTWKVNVNANLNINRERIELTDRIVRNDRDGWNANTLIVRSISGHVSTGVDMRAGRQQQNNRKARVSVTPAIEWNYFPYDQSNRRQLIAHYGAGMQYNRYEETTVFDVMEETVPLHRLGIQYRAVEGWGNAGVNFSASQYLHRSGLYSFGVNGNVSFRVARGLELSLNAGAEKIADEIHIRKAALSEEDILLGRQSLPTSFSYNGSVGFNYRWGSSFSNIVNQRFPGSVR